MRMRQSKIYDENVSETLYIMVVSNLWEKIQRAIYLLLTCLSL